MLLIDATQPLPASHRHLSNLMGLYPFNLITCEGSQHDRTIIKASLAQWDRLGQVRGAGIRFRGCRRLALGLAIQKRGDAISTSS